MRLPLLIFLFVWAVSLKAQVNLVPNPSFEDTVLCPTGLAQITRTKYWSRPSQGSPDYFNECSTNNYISIPSTAFGFNNPRTGNAFVGIDLFCPNCYWYCPVFREYIQVRLQEDLIPMKKYNVSFHVNQADSSKWSIKSIGAFLSSDSMSIGTCIIDEVPQINYSGFFLSDTSNWNIIEGSFIATGAEKYIIIGNFKNDAETEFLSNDYGDSLYVGAYYFIDDVSVTLDTTTGIAETEKPKLKIFPNPAGNQITIEQLSVSGNQLSVEVYDAVGRLVTLSAVEGQTSTIPLNLSKGVYLLRVKEKEEAVFWEKLIIE